MVWRCLNPALPGVSACLGPLAAWPFGRGNKLGDLFRSSNYDRFYPILSPEAFQNRAEIMDGSNQLRCIELTQGYEGPRLRLVNGRPEPAEQRITSSVAILPLSWAQHQGCALSLSVSGPVWGAFGFTRSSHISQSSNDLLMKIRTPGKIFGFRATCFWGLNDARICRMTNAQGRLVGSKEGNVAVGPRSLSPAFPMSKATAAPAAAVWAAWAAPISAEDLDWTSWNVSDL